MAAIKKMEREKAARTDGIAVDTLKYSAVNVIDSSVMIFNISIETGILPEDKKGTFVYMVYKGKGDKKECKNCRETAVLSVHKNI